MARSVAEWLYCAAEINSNEGFGIGWIVPRLCYCFFSKWIGDDVESTNGFGLNC